MAEDNVDGDMKEAINGGNPDQEGMPDLRGMYLLRAINYLRKVGLRLGDIRYDEADFPKFTIIGQSITPGSPISPGSVVDLKVASVNPVRFLPSVYQSNEQLKRFLWIFQHIFNSINYKLDNIHRYFNPIEAPKGFYKWLASWFSINVNYEISEEKMRYLIKDAISLYQWRGTKAGMEKYLEILTDVRPTILENYYPHTEYVVRGDRLVESHILHEKTSKHCFTVRFPVAPNYFDFQTIKKIHQIIESEKPAHADFYIQFQPEAKKELKTSFIIGKETFR